MDSGRTTDGRGNGVFILAAVIFVSLAMTFRSSFEFWINTDATAYVSVARQYLAGGFARAVNGYWGPLFSWLLVPGLAAGLAPLVAARCVELAAGLATLFAARWLALRLGASRRSMGVLALCLAVPLASYSMIVVTPDILLLFLLVMYCGVVLPDTYRERRLPGAAAGLFGGLAYLAKSYALPFFLLHFTLINLVHVYRAGVAPIGVPDGTGVGGRRRAVLLNFAAGVAVFMLVAGPWVGALSHKYGKFTFGTAGQRAHCLVGPEYYGDDPVFSTLIDPPSFDATSYWDDPTVVKLVAWRPWQSKALFYHQLSVVGINLLATVRQLTTAIPFALATLLYFLGAARGRCAPLEKTVGTEPDPPEHAEHAVFPSLEGRPPCRPPPDLAAAPPLRNIALPLLLTVGVYAGGYMPVFVELRYLWPVVVLLILMTVLVLQQFAITHRFRPAVWTFLATWLVLTCMAVPMNNLLASPHRGKDALVLARKLADDYRVHGNLASNDRWATSLFAAFHMKARYFGRVPEELVANEERLVEALKKHGIDYYLDWGPEDRLTPGPFVASRFPEVTGGAINGLRVYAISTQAGSTP